MTLPRAFILAVIAGTVGVLLAATQPARPVSAPLKASPRAAGFDAPRLAVGISVTGQIAVEDVRRIAASGYRTIIDFRPDGEAPDQASAATLAAAARAAGLRFVYIPTPPSTTPEPSVERLADVLAASDGPVMLYCRVGSRASRVWALAEAGRPRGASAADIAASVHNAGHRVDDLLPAIEARIAMRRPS
jgi:sulfide:quinone oxidoreductase